jgi:hypothetical protein
MNFFVPLLINHFDLCEHYADKIQDPAKLLKSITDPSYGTGGSFLAPYD